MQNKQGALQHKVPTQQKGHVIAKHVSLFSVQDELEEKQEKKTQ